MIISVSRRTDVPAYFAEWFFSRLSEGYVEVVSPFNIRLIRYIPLRPDDVDAFVFWTKNPYPMLDKLNLLKDYHYYFHFTLNPYNNDIEVNLPQLWQRIDTFKALSDVIGAHRVIWRYDPVLLGGEINIDFHIRNFEEISKRLEGYTEKVIFSYIDYYKKIEAALKVLNITTLEHEQKLTVAKNFSKIAHAFGFVIESCSENIDLTHYDISPASCIDARLLERIIGKTISYKKDKNQRQFCACAASTDIGMYKSCRTGCVYCYAK